MPAIKYNDTVALLEAIKTKNTKKALMLIQHSADLLYVTLPDDKTLIQYCAEAGSWDMAFTIAQHILSHYLSLKTNTFDNARQTILTNPTTSSRATNKDFAELLSNIYQELYCPIEMTLMQKPVRFHSGQSCSANKEILKLSTCPLTREAQPRNIPPIKNSGLTQVSIWWQLAEKGHMQCNDTTWIRVLIEILGNYQADIQNNKPDIRLKNIAKLSNQYIDKQLATIISCDKQQETLTEILRHDTKDTNLLVLLAEQNEWTIIQQILENPPFELSTFYDFSCVLLHAAKANQWEFFHRIITDYPYKPAMFTEGIHKGWHTQDFLAKAMPDQTSRTVRHQIEKKLFSRSSTDEIYEVATIAIQKGHWEWLQQLDEYLETGGKYITCTLYTAISQKNIGLIDHIINNYPLSFTFKLNDNTIIACLAKSGHWSSVETLAKKPGEYTTDDAEQFGIALYYAFKTIYSKPENQTAKNAIYALLRHNTQSQFQVKSTPYFAAHYATAHQDTQLLAQLLANNANATNKTIQGTLTPLAIALKYNQYDTVNILLSYRAKASCDDQKFLVALAKKREWRTIELYEARIGLTNWTAGILLHQAITEKNSSRIDWLLEKTMPNLSIKLAEKTAIVRFAEMHEWCRVKQFCKTVQNTPEDSAQIGRAAFIALAFLKDNPNHIDCKEAITLLLAQKFICLYWSYDTGPRQGYFPAHFAILQKNTNLLSTLIKKDARQAYSQRGHTVTPLALALSLNHLESVKILLGSNAAPDPTDETHIVSIAKNQHWETINLYFKILISRINIRTESLLCHHLDRSLSIAISQENQSQVTTLLSFAKKIKVEQSTAREKKHFTLFLAELRKNNHATTPNNGQYLFYDTISTYANTVSINAALNFLREEIKRNNILAKPFTPIFHAFYGEERAIPMYTLKRALRTYKTTSSHTFFQLHPEIDALKTLKEKYTNNFARVPYTAVLFAIQDAVKRPGGIPQRVQLFQNPIQQTQLDKGSDKVIQRLGEAYKTKTPAENIAFEERLRHKAYYAP